MLGLFGKSRGQQFTPGIMPQQSGQAPQQYAQMAPQPKPWQDALMRIGGAVKDTTGQGNLAAANESIHGRKQAYGQMMQQQQNLAQLTQGMTPEMAALFKVNPQAATEAMAKLRLGHNTIAGGNSLVTYGPNGQPQLTQAAQNFQNGSRVATVGPNGNLSFDMGQNQDEANTQYANQSTRQNNFATQDLRGGELKETIRNNDFTNANTGFANQTGRMNAGVNQQNANTARMEAENPAAAIPPALAYQMQKDREAKDAAASDVEFKNNQMVTQLARLRDGGDLQGGLANTFGARMPFATKIGGTQASNTKAQIDQITANLTLDKIANFKGAISDKDLEIAQGAATRLNNPNISEKEARLAIDELYTAFGGKPDAPQVNFSDMSDEDLMKIINGG